MGLEINLSASFKEFLGEACEKMPLDITFYEEESICVIKRDSCEYHRLEKEMHLCNKKTYTFIPLNVR
jgi:hypothetical protein